MANGATRGERLQIMLSGEELTVLDDFASRNACQAGPQPSASC
jgi:hypothetical protein